MDTPVSGCELCATPGGVVLWQSSRCRIVRVADSGFPGYCRVIWNAHVREMTDLEAGERQRLMETVFTVEKVVRTLFSPEKINLACLGNMTPHLHWHIIPRWPADSHFPDPIWGTRQRTGAIGLPEVSDRQLTEALGLALDALERETT